MIKTNQLVMCRELCDVCRENNVNTRYYTVWYSA